MDVGAFLNDTLFTPPRLKYLLELARGRHIHINYLLWSVIYFWAFTCAFLCVLSDTDNRRLISPGLIIMTCLTWWRMVLDDRSQPYRPIFFSLGYWCSINGFNSKIARSLIHYVHIIQSALLIQIQIMNLHVRWSVRRKTL